MVNKIEKTVCWANCFDPASVLVKVVSVFISNNRSDHLMNMGKKLVIDMSYNFCNSIPGFFRILCNNIF